MEDKIKELYELIPEGYFNSEQELRDYITDENKLKEVYEFIPKDYFKDSNEYVSYFGETLKKKVSSQDSSPKEFTLQSYSQETPLTEKDWVGDIAVGAVKPAERQYRDWETDRKSTRLNSSHSAKSRMPSSA